ncbi:MAG: 50S ribosomal protein L23 [Deltaproteobacteria bacterium]|nr:50S ribosomal protein L23 [Deltaproteobacteria bacterium]
MKDHYSVILAPVITEKSTAAAASRNKAVFWVDVRANKDDIREAVEKVFNVKVAAVNTYKAPGKVKRLGKYAGKRPTRKKAYVTLEKGHKIGLFEGV